MFVKGLDKGYMFEEDSNSVNSILNDFQKLRARQVTIKASVGNASEGLTLEGTKNLIKNIYKKLLNRSDNNLLGKEDGRITITGRTESQSHVEPIDLIISRYKKTIKLDSGVERLNAHFRTSEKFEKIVNLFFTVKPELEKMYNDI